MKQIKPTNGIIRFVSDNLWNLIITLIAISIAWATLSARVLAVESDQNQIVVRLDKIDNLIERIIVLEEHDKSIVDDIAEIKVDIKDIKRAFNLQ